MKNTNRTSHTVYDHKFHIVFCTKYRKKVLYGDIAKRIQEIIRRVCEEFGVKILQGNIRDNHIHLLLSIPPHYAVSKIVQHMKGVSSRKVQQEFPEIRKHYWGKHFWAIGFYSATCGTVSDETISDYIKNQNESDDENFKVGY